MDSNEIKEVIQTYFDASYESDGGKIAQVFHANAHIYGHSEDGSLEDMDKAAFVNLVGAHGQSATPGFPRYNEIISIDFTGENTAAARVKLRVFDTIYTDILCFMRIGGTWGVISKVMSGAACT